MDGIVTFEHISAISAVSVCLFLAVFYIGSLYVWTSNLPRDHPQTIKERVVRVFISCILSIILLYCLSSEVTSEDTKYRGTFLQWMGIRSNSFVFAATLPLSLFMILFLGPLYMNFVDGGLIFLHPKYWKDYFKDLICWRNYFVAPFSEEMVFRGCMLPLLLPAFGSWKSILLAPSFFGIAHIHHAWEKYYTDNYPLSSVVMTTIFQTFYTTIFGALSSWLFLRTGHLVSAVVCHSFCNVMGFPDFDGALQHKNRIQIAFAYVAGLVLFLLLAQALTAPSLYDNNIYDK